MKDSIATWLCLGDFYYVEVIHQIIWCRLITKLQECSVIQSFIWQSKTTRFPKMWVRTLKLKFYVLEDRLTPITITINWSVRKSTDMSDSAHPRTLVSPVHVEETGTSYHSVFLPLSTRTFTSVTISLMIKKYFKWTFYRLYYSNS